MIAITSMPNAYEEGIGMAEVEESGAHAAAEDVERVGAPSVSVKEPVDVAVGGGGDPLVFGLPVFVSGSLVLGFALVSFVTLPDNLGSVLPETTFATGLGEFVTALWAIIVGQSIVAAIFGLFAAFWFSLFALTLGVYHAGWFQFGLIAGGHKASSAQMAANTPTLQMFFIAWLIVFIFLTIGMLRLPISYVLILVAVDVAVLFVLLAVTYTAHASVFFSVAGAAVLAFCAIGLYDFVGLALASTGAKKVWPPLGPPPIK
jgi:succinate-acetate transporter protein